MSTADHGGCRMPRSDEELVGGDFAETYPEMYSEVSCEEIA